jgi:hypothetical protein
MMGLEAGVAEPTLANATKRYPIRTARDNRTHGVLPLPLSFVSKIEK